LNIIVQKFGGTSMANKESIKLVVKKITQELTKNKKVITIVSAPSGITNYLQKLIKEMSPNPSNKELDLILSLGENISISVLSSILKNNDIKSSFVNPRDIDLITDNNFNNAKIKRIDINKIYDLLRLYDVLIIPGFQGISEKFEVTTLGRGGSDITAIAIAAALSLEYVDIYTDVDYVYSCDPKLVKNPIKNKSLSYEEMIELSSSGAKVLHNRSVEIAHKYDLKINLKNTFSNKTGTIIHDNIEKSFISGISLLEDNFIINFEISNLKDLSDFFKILSENKININIVSQSLKNISISINNKYYEKTISLLNTIKSNINILNINIYKNLSKISIVGDGIKDNYGIISKIINTLNQNKININMISCSEINISLLIDKKNICKAINLLHYELIESDLKKQEEII
jgi:aspartate kinase